MTFSAFVSAVVFNQTSALKMIRSNPEWLTAVSGTGETALADVVIEDYLTAAQFLIEQGADVNTPDYSGATPLMYAAQLGYQDIVKLLLDSGADVNREDDLEETPLFKSARSGYAEICDMLLLAGATVKDNMLEDTIFDVILPRKRPHLLKVFAQYGYTESATAS